MKRINHGRFLSVVLLGLFTCMLCPPPASGGPRKPEADLIAMLSSPDPQKVLDALDRLPNWYPNSTNAIEEIKKLLNSHRVPGGDFPPKILTRKAARALGNYHATLEWKDLSIIIGLLNSSDANQVMDGLKALRGLNEPPDLQRKIAEQILPLLKNKEVHIVRDACRTLAVHGNQQDIPALEPLLKQFRRDVKKDAKDAIAALRAKA